jgi:hypothetical protein
MENRHGLVLDACTLPATGTAEGEAGLALVGRLPRGRATISGDKGCDQHAFVDGVSGSCPARDTSRRKRPATIPELLKESGDLKIELDFTADGNLVTSSMIPGKRVRQMPQDWKFEGGKVVIGAKTLELDGKLIKGPLLDGHPGAAYLRKP